MVRKVSDEQILTLHQQGMNQVEIGRALGVSNVAIHKRLKRILANERLAGLTPKEQKFCLAVAQGKSRTQAAMDAYDVSSRESAKTLQNSLMQKPEIREGIDIAVEMATQGLTRSHMVSTLKRHVDNETDPHVSLKGLDMGFRLTNSYPATKNINLNLTADLSPVDLSRYRLNPAPVEDITDIDG